MERHFSGCASRARRLLIAAAAVTAFVVVALPAAAGDLGVFNVKNLVSDGFVPAERTDPNLVNGWGLVAGPTTPWWVADNGTDVATIYAGDGTPNPLVVSVEGGPTGTVFNGGSGFVVSSGGASGAARFIFASEDGKIRGWSPAVPPPAPAQAAIVAADRSHDGAIYKGLAIASTAHGDFLYAADFHNARVDVFDSGFQLVTSPGAFVDPRLPHGYAPFGIRNLDGRIFVAYAKQDEEAEDEIAGPGFGFVSMFDTAGTFLRRVASRGKLNAPWGLALAPAGFGQAGGDLLVGNFGDGRINAYVPTADGPFDGQGPLRGADGHPIVIDGLWGIAFGNGAAAGPTTTLFFAAGPGDEEHGLFGSISAG
jgi:uncharacterized protein (TIGR03118 family)